MKFKGWQAKFFESPQWNDFLILSVLTIFITFQPFFMHGEINIFETGLYLPGIDAVIKGAVPFRDVFHLRGPFELYMPAFLMKMFGAHITDMYSYFYFGNVLCLILCVAIAKELFKSRGLLYLLTLVLIARTWPRIVFMYWGGMRYAWGLLALWFIVRYFKGAKTRDAVLAGVVASLGLFTSIEIGIYILLGFVTALLVSAAFRVQKISEVIKALGAFAIGMLAIIIPFSLYLASQQAFFPYLDGVVTIVRDMQKVIDPHMVSIYPQNFSEALQAMFNPTHTNFKHMTPSYLYIILLVYIFFKVRRKNLDKTDLFIICLGVYGFIMYNTGFRGIWASQFEMALQPEKILLFYLFEFGTLYLLAASQALDATKKMKYAFNIVCAILLVSSVGYAMQRYNHRFFVIKNIGRVVAGKKIDQLRQYEGEPQSLSIPRARGTRVSIAQAQELEAVYSFTQKNIAKDEIVMSYPEMGTYNFLIERPFFSRFTIGTFPWFNDRWFAEFMGQLEANRPRYIILQKVMSENWHNVYMAKEPNREKYYATMDFIKQNYHVREETPQSYIMEKNL